MLKAPFLFILILSFAASAQKLDWLNIDTKTNASFRGLSVVNDSVAWVSGSQGWVGSTTNGGTNWSFRQVAGFEKCDFRSLYAFNAKKAIIANAGVPALVLLTQDGGATWHKVYENKDTAAFIDGIDFWNERKGIVYGDPIDKQMLLLNTADGGKTWAERTLADRPLLSDGEASFAASGTCVKCIRRKGVIIATGGKISRILFSKNRGKSWRSIATPILQGGAGTGIFSYLYLSHRHWIIAGGDYKNDTLRKDNLFYSLDAGKTWISPATTTRGYRECLSQAPDGTLLAVGPGGIDVSADNGKNWKAVSNEKQYHVISRARDGNLLIMAGGGGKISVLRTFP